MRGRTTKVKRDEPVSHYCLPKNIIIQNMPAANYADKNFITAQQIKENYPQGVYSTKQPTKEETDKYS